MFLQEQHHSGNSNYINGVSYVLKDSITEQNKKELTLYIHTIERNYGGNLFLNEKAKKLIYEVRSKFSKLISNKNKEWKKLPPPFNRFKI